MMVRMFHIQCDAPDHSITAMEDDLGDHWYADDAVKFAKSEGYRLRNYTAICPECWDAGVRFKDLSQ